MSLVSDETIWACWYLLSLPTRQALIKKYSGEHAAAYAYYSQSHDPV